MQLFLDTANVDEIRQANDWGLLDGVTTNPTTVALTGRSYADVVLEICSIVDGPVSAETVGLDAEAIVREGRELAGLHPNVVVKVPVMPEGLKAVKQLAEDGIRTNVTVTFQPLQALLAAKAGASFISPFVDRLNRVGEDGFQVVRQIKQMYSHYDFGTQILVASVRSPLTVVQAALEGADCCTMPFDIFQQLYKHPLTDLGIEMFLSDAAKIPKPSRKSAAPA